MRRVDLKHIPVRPPNPFLGWQGKVHTAVLFAFLGTWLLIWSRLWLPSLASSTARWADGLLLILATATTLASLSRQLPAQNVVLVSVVIGAMAGGAQALAALTAVPFGPIVFRKENIGQLLFDTLPWAVPLIWTAAILNARGVARLMLRSRRRKPNYGFWVIGLTIVLVVLFDLVLEPYATEAKQYWTWKPTKIPWGWHGTPLVNFLGWAVTTLVILLFVTPALINKSPTPPPPSYHPLIVWELLIGLLVTGAILNRIWSATIVGLCQMPIVGGLCLLGARKRSRASTQNDASTKPGITAD